MRLFAYLFTALVASESAFAVEFFVSPSGSDQNAGTSKDAPFQTIPKAQQAVRSSVSSMNGNITVNLAPGKYFLTSPLKLGAEDSGSNGYSVIWSGAGALLSGGTKITTWTSQSNGIYVADVAKGIKSRSLFVNGKAANFARRKVANRKDFTYTATGIKWSSGNYDWITSTAGIASAEVRFINSFTDRYAPIRSVGNKELVMEQNGWFNQMWGYDTPSKNNADFGVWIQNALALLSEGGQFYLDSAAGKLYYKPLNGEDMSKVDAYLATLETIVAVGGTYASPAHDIVFKDVSYAHSTWNLPTDYGYVDMQTGGHICENKTYTSNNFESTRPWWCQMPSAVQISAAKNIAFTGGNYTQLGGGGVGIGNDANAHMTGVGLSASYVSIADGYFTQVMGNSVTAGGIRADAHHPSDAKMTVSHITISGNIFYNVSSLYSSTVPIFVSYIQDSAVSHNDIYVTPYSGICIGYGWGSNDAGGSQEYTNRGLYNFQPKYTTPTTLKNNVIEGNLIHGYGYSHTDLGAIYTLSNAPGTKIVDNYAFDSGAYGMYNDEGSNGYTMTGNIMMNSGTWLAQNQAKDNTITGNFGRSGPNRSGNTLVSGISQVSASGKNAANRAGVLPEKRAGRPVSNPSNA
ncbi:hypothetical protein BCR34DRAFT_652167 [Clohesyomyces aquaticus]|uniref:Pectin lyase fold/virulence factor n=1 Tax=Clohesyomyces aquaticus TaxID=1231657 RepID=A0A1Y1ZN83_9PLEO|nr:hypothetical protein BCR34DRAFT_652167 [Clohesyomyces aquaticus]